MKTLLSLGLVMMIASAAAAQLPPQMMQPMPPLRPPTVSPYLNMLRRDALPYQNYFGLVQPQLSNQQALNTLQQSVLGLQNMPQSVYVGTGSELFTGKVTGYFTHRAYFMTNSGMGVPRTLTGQMGAPTNNTIFQQNPVMNPQQPGSPIAPNSIMPFRR